MAVHPVLQAGNTALITGAASGVGLAVAKLCVKHGMKLALVDNNEAALKEVQSSVFRDSVDAKIYSIDVSQIEQWKDLRVKVEMDFGQISFLVLNAGIAQNSVWDDTQYFHNVSRESYGCVVLDDLLSTRISLSCCFQKYPPKLRTSAHTTCR